MPHDALFQKRAECIFNLKKCSESNWEKFAFTQDFESSHGHFEIIRCQVCDMGLTTPFPAKETIAQLYEGRDTSNFDPPSIRLIERLKDWFAERDLRRIIGAPLPGKMVSKRILDFATGNGRYAQVAQAMFPRCHVFAADFESAPPERLKGSGVTYSSFDNLSEIRDKFDIIILRHVLEHTHDPVPFLRQLADMLADDGKIYIEVPNIDCQMIFFSRGLWPGFYAPFHICHFSPKSLGITLQLSGLTGPIKGSNMPMLGNTIAAMFGLEKSNLFSKLIGACLYPLELVVQGRELKRSCLWSLCHKT